MAYKLFIVCVCLSVCVCVRVCVCVCMCVCVNLPIITAVGLFNNWEGVWEACFLWSCRSEEVVLIEVSYWKTLCLHPTGRPLGINSSRSILMHTHSICLVFNPKVRAFTCTHTYTHTDTRTYRNSSTYTHSLLCLLVFILCTYVICSYFVTCCLSYNVL